jgi:hypothetical protein
MDEPVTLEVLSRRLEQMIAKQREMRVELSSFRSGQTTLTDLVTRLRATQSRSGRRWSGSIASSPRSRVRRRRLSPAVRRAQPS